MCESPAESPTTPFVPDKTQTSAIYPRFNTTLPRDSLIIPFVIYVEWEVAKIQDIQMVIQKQNGTNGTWVLHETGVAVDVHIQECVGVRDGKNEVHVDGDTFDTWDVE